jgi:hypothetical protein
VAALLDNYIYSCILFFRCFNARMHAGSKPTARGGVASTTCRSTPRGSLLKNTISFTPQRVLPQRRNSPLLTSVVLLQTNGHKQVNPVLMFLDYQVSFSEETATLIMPPVLDLSLNKYQHLEDLLSRPSEDGGGGFGGGNGDDDSGKRSR